MAGTTRTKNDEAPLESLDDLDRTLLELMAAGYLQYGRQRQTPRVLLNRDYRVHGNAQGDWLNVTEDEVRI